MALQRQPVPWKEEDVKKRTRRTKRTFFCESIFFAGGGWAACDFDFATIPAIRALGRSKWPAFEGTLKPVRMAGLRRTLEDVLYPPYTTSRVFLLLALGDYTVGKVAAHPSAQCDRVNSRSDIAIGLIHGGQPE